MIKARMQVRVFVHTYISHPDGSIYRRIRPHYPWGRNITIKAHGMLSVPFFDENVFVVL